MNAENMQNDPIFGKLRDQKLGKDFRLATVECSEKVIIRWYSLFKNRVTKMALISKPDIRIAHDSRLMLIHIIGKNCQSFSSIAQT